MIAEFQTEYFVGVQQSVTLTCEAEGNPQPTYSWIPCDTEQVCNKNTLVISQVLDDASYTCRVVNIHGPDTKTAVVCKLHNAFLHLHLQLHTHAPMLHFDWVLKVEQGVFISLSGCVAKVVISSYFPKRCLTPYDE